MKKIYYIHGFNSGIKEDKIEQLSKDLELNITGLYFDSSKDFNENLINMFKDFNIGDENIFIGTSLGAYYANVISFITFDRCILTNPSLEPIHTLKKYLGENKNFVSNGIYDFNEKILNSYKHIFDLSNKPLILLSENDKVIDSKYTFDKYKDETDVIMFDGGEHRFKFYKESKNIILNYINSDR